MMRGFLKFLIVFSSILLLSAVLAPFLYDFLPWLGQFFSDDPEFMQFKFEKIFNRLIMIGSLIAILKFVRIKKETFVKYGLDWSRERGSAFLKTFLISILVLSIFVFVRSSFGHALFQPKPLGFLGWVGAVFEVSIAVLLITVIEEFFFRGFIQSTLKDRFRFNLFFTVLITNVFYASLHFVSHKKPFVGSDPSIVDSFRIMAAPFMSVADIQGIWMAALGLFIFGVILSSLVIRSGSLYPSMGVHAGCVFFLKLDGKFVEFLHNDWVSFWGSTQIYDGYLGWVFLIILGVLSMMFLNRTDKLRKVAAE